MTKLSLWKTISLFCVCCAVEVIGSPAQTFNTLHSFDGTDGAYPEAGMLQATDGSLYGTTATGGASDNGTVFKITPAGKLTTLHSFCTEPNCSDGAVPYAGLVQATDGNFYGTTQNGGANDLGTVFKIIPSGTLTTLYSFGSQSGDGFQPAAGLVQATDGNLYGTTTSGAFTAYYGTAFKITPGGKLTTLHSFDVTDGASPQAALVQATNGNFYGTAPYGGVNDDGTLFSLAVGLGPFVEAEPTSGKVGTPVRILGTNLADVSCVMFNGRAAAFTVVSSSEIKTTVPEAATTGFVTVTTSGKTLKSNVKFRVP